MDNTSISWPRALAPFADVRLAERGSPGEAVAQLPKGADFKAKYKAKFGTDVEVYSPYSYDAVYVIADAIKRAGKDDKASILAAMPATSYPGLTGTISFDEKGDVKGGAISVFNVVDGKLAYISTSK